MVKVRLKSKGTQEKDALDPWSVRTWQIGREERAPLANIAPEDGRLWPIGRQERVNLGP